MPEEFKQIQEYEEMDPHRDCDPFIIPYELVSYQGLSPMAKFLYGVLKYNSFKGKVHITQKDLSEELGCSQSSIERLIKELKDEFFIKVVAPTPKERMEGKTAQYVFLRNQFFLDRYIYRKGIKDEKKKAQIEKRASQKVNRKKKVAASHPTPPVEKKEEPIDRDGFGWGLPNVKPIYYDPYED